MHAPARRHATRTRTAAAWYLLGPLVAGLFAAPAAAWAEPGGLSQRAGAKGCVSEDGSPGCRKGDLLTGAFSVTVSPDGKHAYVALAEDRGVAVLARNARTGALTQLPSPLGCVSDTGNGGLCATGRGLQTPVASTTSPDGRHVYVVSHQRDPVTITAVALFARDATTGALTQLPGTQGCISEHLGPDVCTPAVGLLSARSVAVSRDGKHVYVAAEADSVAVFARDAATGALTQLAEPHGCVSQSGSGGRCTQGKALDGAYAVVVSKDGRFVYVASQLSHAVAVFRRHRKTGVLTQLPDEAGCIAADGSAEHCTDGAGLRGPTALALSPNGKSVYVVSDGGSELAVLARHRRTGALRPVQCFDDHGSAACELAVEMSQPHSVAISPDGERVYVAARDSNAVAVFARDAATGALLQPDGRAACISDDGSEGLCTDGRALDHPRSVTVSHDGRHVYVAAQGSGVAVLQPRRSTPDRD